MPLAGSGAELISAAMLLGAKKKNQGVNRKRSEPNSVELQQYIPAMALP